MPRADSLPVHESLALGARVTRFTQTHPGDPREARTIVLDRERPKAPTHNLNDATDD
jgi:hypothetical protein